MNWTLPRPGWVLYLPIAIVLLIYVLGLWRSEAQWDAHNYTTPFVSHMTDGAGIRYVWGFSILIYIFAIVLWTCTYLMLHRRRVATWVYWVYALAQGVTFATTLLFAITPATRNLSRHCDYSIAFTTAAVFFETVETLVRPTRPKWIVVALVYLISFTYIGLRLAGRCDRMDYPHSYWSCVAAEHAGIDLLLLFPLTLYAELFKRNRR